MNTIGEKINVIEKVKMCRVLVLSDLNAYLKADIMKYWSWGVQELIVNSKKNPTVLRFTVNGQHHKGYVYIFLNGLDLFDVYLTDFSCKIKVIGTDLYFDDLADWIDEKVERIPEYVR